MIDTSPFGVYVHIPFCAHRCDYCDFATWSDRDHLIDPYVEACVAQLHNERHQFEGRPATSVFFGGGTPSLLEPEQLVAILNEIPRATNCETTVECNPDRVDANKFGVYADAGVNRVSFGVQSTSAHVLAALGRTHDRDNVRRSVEWARAAGIDNINLDIIYGTPGETLQDWEATLSDVTALDPTHISAYALTVEPATPLGLNVRQGTAAAPDDDDLARKYDQTESWLSSMGYDWYEISNWSKAEKACRHNQLYWTMGEYLAIGCAAHGHQRGVRFWNFRTPQRYIDAIAQNESPVAGSEQLDADASSEEAFGLGLRLRVGISIAAPSASAKACIDELATAGFVEFQQPNLRLLQPGRLLANDLTARLINAGVSAR